MNSNRQEKNKFSNSQVNVQQLRVLISGHLPPPMGGVGTYYKSLLSSSLPQRINLSFVQSSTQKRELSQSGRISISNLFEALKDWGRFYRAVASHRPAVSHIGAAFGLSFVKHSVNVLIARLFGSRVLLHPHCGLPILYTDRSKLWRWYFRQVVRLTDGLIVLSSEWNQIQELIPGCRVFYLKNAINLAPYLRIANERLADNSRDGNKRVLYLGYLGQAKGSFDLLQAAEILSKNGVDIVVDLIGSELHIGELDRLKNDLNDAKLSEVVRIHPPIYGDEKYKYFRESDIFVYPSYSEGMPMAVIEAMASGLPIVASNVGGLPDLVKDKLNGLLVEPGRSDQIAEAIQKLAADSELRRSMGRESNRIATEQYDIEQHVSKLVGIYQACAQQSNTQDVIAYDE